MTQNWLLKKDCPVMKGNKTNKKSTDANVANEGYESAKAIIVTDGRISSEWVMDFGCSFHMCPMSTSLET